jgi:putative DNA primase/helicase
MFQDFALQHGLIIDTLVFDQWVRVKTLDKPNKKNGAYIFDGQFGAIINFAMHESHISYRENDTYVPTAQDRAKRELANQERIRRQDEAKRKAAFIVRSAVLMQHPYLLRKGFEDKGYVWNNLLILPMRIDGRLVGCQMIQEDGTKRFLSGQITKGASLIIDNKGSDFICEGFATGLSVRRALKSIKVRYKIHVCFSASNMIEIAKHLEKPLVIADNDAMGVATAKKIASLYWVGEANEDFNDTEQRIGTQLAAESLRVFL